MMETLDRDEIIRLLDQLGGDQDADVIQAARDLHTQITAAGMDWDDLLIPDSSAEPADEDDTTAPDDTDAADTAAARPAGKQGKNADTLALLDKLLALPDRSDALREELEEYKADIASGDFQAGDHQYVRALYNRLKK
jgi:hypothetical protein